MRELIRSGEMEPKARINEGELTERFGISRTPLREAIKILATEGLLELLPNRGARVASISETELEEMMEVIAGLEATAGDLACRTISEAEIDAIEVDHNAMVAAWKGGDEAGISATTGGSTKASWRPAATACWPTSTRACRAGSSGRATRPADPDQWARAVSEHERMIALLRARDGAALAVLMREHIRGKKSVIAANYGVAERR